MMDFTVIGRSFRDIPEDGSRYEEARAQLCRACHHIFIYAVDRHCERSSGELRVQIAKQQIVR